MHVRFVVVCILLFLTVPGDAQTAVQSKVSPENGKDNPERSANGYRRQTNTSPPVVPQSAPAPLSNASTREQGQLPNASHATLEEVDPPGRFDWRLSNPVESQQHNFIRPPIWDKKMLVADMVLASSMLLDTEVTHEGIAHHRCEEGNLSLPGHPSRGELYTYNLLEFAPITLFDWWVAKAVRNGHLPRWYWKSISYMGPVGGSVSHFQGGVRWLTNCW